MPRGILTAAVAAAMLTLTACAGAAATAGDPEPDTPTSAPEQVAGMCAQGVTDCVDVIVETEFPDDAADQFDSEAALAAARALLGKAEDELGEQARVGRKGDEHMALTEDYVLGRLTVELDADAAGVFRVVRVIVELPDGPETVTD